jgi:hypothetical protein
MKKTKQTIKRHIQVCFCNFETFMDYSDIDSDSTLRTKMTVYSKKKGCHGHFHAEATIKFLSSHPK